MRDELTGCGHSAGLFVCFRGSKTAKTLILVYMFMVGFGPSVLRHLRGVGGAERDHET